MGASSTRHSFPEDFIGNGRSRDEITAEASRLTDQGYRRRLPSSCLRIPMFELHSMENVKLVKTLAYEHLAFV